MQKSGGARAKGKAPKAPCVTVRSVTQSIYLSSGGDGVVPMTKVEYQGEAFLLDDSNGCYVEVTYGDLVGYVGPNLSQGTVDKPHTWWAPGDFGGAVVSVVTKDGLTSGPGGQFATPEAALHQLYAWLIRKRKESDGRKAFKPEVACEALHEYMKELANR